MSSLESLAKNHNKWLNYANRLTNDLDTANDLVQDMYLKIHSAEPIQVNTSYVYTTIRNLFFDEVKRKSFLQYGIEDFTDDNKTKNDVFELVQDKLSKLDPFYSELALMQADGKSYRQIAYLYKIGRNKCYNNIAKIKLELKQDKDIKKWHERNQKD